ncbi:hypothetical protein [Nitrosomonas sp.]|uniref:hypothetical protein n=1 Tax=Nitrosomonas sp. TaxID=42353 RepID=UPI0020824B19|nr:hypothetical protein [Nitrosomonas sp.]GJL76048.1 MAG: hypothetical protein NMNS02_21540 [Nitrosomonas sp.]
MTELRARDQEVRAHEQAAAMAAEARAELNNQSLHKPEAPDSQNRMIHVQDAYRTASEIN